MSQSIIRKSVQLAKFFIQETDYTICISVQAGAVYESLEMLRSGAESYRKIETPSVNKAINGYFLNQGRIKQRKMMDGLRLLSAVPKMQWAS